MFLFVIHYIYHFGSNLVATELRITVAYCTHRMAHVVGSLAWMERHLWNIGNNIRTAEDRVHVPSTRSLITAVLICALSGDASLAEYFLISVARRTGNRHQSVHIPLLSLEFMEELLSNQRIKRAVSRAYHDLSNRYRLVADKFLMNSLLADYVIQQNLKGVVITADTAIVQYLKLWSLRDVAEKTRSWLLKLTHNVRARKRFGQQFRKEWALQFGVLKVKKALDANATRRKVFLLIRRGPCENWCFCFECLERLMFLFITALIQTIPYAFFVTTETRS